jgi:chitosanase
MRRGLVLLVAAGASALLAAAPSTGSSDLATPAKKEIAMQLVSSAENSSLDWRAQYRYIQDIHDGRGYTAGIIGFCSGTGDMLEVVEAYTKARRGNPLARFVRALRKVDGTESHAGLGRPFVRAWRQAASDPAFQRAQNRERDTVYFNPSVRLAKSDGLNALGQFAYYDAAVVHGFDGMRGVRRRALARATTPAAGGDERAYLEAFLDERVVEMNKEAAHEDVTRIETAQRRFLREGNLDLDPPLRWAVYGDRYFIPAE